MALCIEHKIQLSMTRLPSEDGILVGFFLGGHDAVSSTRTSPRFGASIVLKF